MNRAFTYWKTVVWSVFMLILFLLPAGNFSKAPPLPGLSELIHAFMFAVFTFLLVYEQLRNGNINYPVHRNYIIAILLSISFGILIEFLQKISGFGRTAEFLDLVYDMAGCLIVVILLMIYGSIRRSGLFKD
ncbi:VanZ family protein [Bacteroidota bacterium]